MLFELFSPTVSTPTASKRRCLIAFPMLGILLTGRSRRKARVPCVCVRVRVCVCVGEVLSLFILLCLYFIFLSIDTHTHTHTHLAGGWHTKLAVGFVYVCSHLVWLWVWV